MKRNAGYATRVKLDFLYDSQHRRVSKAVSTTTSQLANPAWTLQGTTRFLYDDWNMIAQYSFAANVFTAQAQYVWGLDVNGAMQGAGGVGGLLHAVLIDSANAPCLPCYDGNGNIAAWVHGGNGSLIERREYDSFGNMITVYRLAADAALHAKLFYGFSTKWRDPESELLYYGHRYYNPNTQRWLNRDPIQEAGGINLYGFVGNDGVNQWDLLGLDPVGHVIWEAYKMRLHTTPATSGKNRREDWFVVNGEPDETMKKYTQIQRESQYYNHADYLRKKGELLMNEWKTIHISAKPSYNPESLKNSGATIIKNQIGSMGVGNDWSLYHLGIAPKDGRFWLGSPGHIKVSGEIEYCWDGTHYYARETDTVIVWVDRIDANPNSNDDPLKFFLEYITKGTEMTFGQDFNVLVYFTDKTPNVRQIGP